ncbi:PP0621 family protein [Sulfuricystis multivorans]|uniref:PP0621 family protein n=1 Tax=Sulfuricystis multivorans TaxID=2211108 RepID=UPI000F817487|nr:PP0621 family protein [Sulfuricystis multivorans]
MSKLLLLLIVFALLIWLLPRQRKADAPDQGETPIQRPAEKMVICAHCGIHLPESEALIAKERYYCSQEHLRQGPAA